MMHLIKLHRKEEHAIAHQDYIPPVILASLVQTDAKHVSLLTYVFNAIKHFLKLMELALLLPIILTILSQTTY